MAQIKEYANQENVNPGVFEGAAYSIERYGQVQQRNIEQGARGISDAAAAVEKHEAKIDLSAFQSADAQYATDKQAEYDQLKMTKDPLDTSWQADWIQNYREGAMKLTDGIRNSDVQSYAQQRVNERTEQMARTVHGESAERQTKGLIDNFHNTIDQEANRAHDHPEHVADYANNASEAGLTVPGAARDEAVRQARAHVVGSAADGIVTALQKIPPQDMTMERLDAAYNLLTKDGGIFKKEMLPAQYDKLTDDITRMKNDLPRLQEVVSAQQMRKDRQEFVQAAAEFRGDTFDLQGNTILPPQYGERLQALSNMPGVEEGTLAALQNRITDIKQGHLVTSDPALWNHYLERAALPPTDKRALTETELMVAEHNHSLSNEDTTRLLRVRADAAKDRVYRGALGQVNKFLSKEESTFFPSRDPITGFVDNTAHDRFMQYRSAVLDSFQHMYDAGEDPATGLRPDQTKYFGNFRDNFSLARKGATNPYITPSLDNSPVIPKIKGDTDPAFVNLPKGAPYEGPDGKQYRKR